MIKKLASTFSAVLLLLSLATVLPVSASPTTYVSVINATSGYGVPEFYGTTTINFTNEYPPPTAADYPLGYFIVNITVTSVTNLAGWQINVTWDPTLLEIAVDTDIYRPADAIFGATAIETGKNIKPGMVYWAVSRGIGQPAFTGSGRLCQIKFNITQVPASVLTCPLHHDQVSAFPTKITDTAGDPIPYTPEDGTYEYSKIFFIPKPYLEVCPEDVVQGWPKGPTIIGTPKENFTVDVCINNIVADAKLIAYQFKFIWNRTSSFDFIKIEEGPFLKNPTWAPDGTFFTTAGAGMNATHKWFLVLAVIWNWTQMTVFPDSTGLSCAERSLCTITFKSTVQEQDPWTIYTPNAFFVTYVWKLYPERVFENYDEEFIPCKPQSEWIQGNYKIYGYLLITGRYIDVYTQYPNPYGGQGINQPSDMFWPQKQVELYANVSYNMWPQQNKVVTFEIRDPHNHLVTVLTAITNETGTAHTSYRIPWPCVNTSDLFGIWAVTASVDVACTIINDTLWFHFDYLVHWDKVTVDPTSVNHLQNVTITVNFQSYAWIQNATAPYYDVYITVFIHDELNYPIGGYMSLIPIGEGLELNDRGDWSNETFCHYGNYTWTFRIRIEKWAVPFIAQVHVNALSNLPSLGGCAWTPEYTPIPEFTIQAK